MTSKLDVVPHAHAELYSCFLGACITFVLNCCDVLKICLLDGLHLRSYFFFPVRVTFCGLYEMCIGEMWTWILVLLQDLKAVELKPTMYDGLLECPGAIVSWMI